MDKCTAEVNMRQDGLAAQKLIRLRSVLHAGCKGRRVVSGPAMRLC